LNIEDIKIEAKCLSGKMAPTLTGAGIFFPCCLAGRGDNVYNVYKEDPYFLNNGFYDLNIKDCDDIISEIFNSPQWITFFDLIENNPKEAPQVCKEFCGVNNASS
jgi:hypothetical protein